MFQAFKRHRHQWEDVAAAALALGYSRRLRGGGGIRPRPAGLPQQLLNGSAIGTLAR